MQPESNKPDKPAGGYGKRPLWQWIIIYLVVAVIVYGLIYLLFLNGNSGPGLGY
jgi:flagellar basal body-associated protein FliL